MVAPGTPDMVATLGRLVAKGWVERDHVLHALLEAARVAGAPELEARMALRLDAAVHAHEARMQAAERVVTAAVQVGLWARRPPDELRQMARDADPGRVLRRVDREAVVLREFAWMARRKAGAPPVGP